MVFLFQQVKLPGMPNEAVEAAANKFGGNRWVVKAQVHAGGRGKAGGVKLVSSKDELAQCRQRFVRHTFSDLSNGCSMVNLLIKY